MNPHASAVPCQAPAGHAGQSIRTIGLIRSSRTASRAAVGIMRRDFTQNEGRRTSNYGKPGAASTIPLNDGFRTF